MIFQIIKFASFSIAGLNIAKTLLCKSCSLSDLNLFSELNITRRIPNGRRLDYTVLEMGRWLQETNEILGFLLKRSKVIFRDQSEITSILLSFFYLQI